MNYVIWHNPRCSKSRQTLQLLRDNGVEPEVVKYLDNPPSTEEIERVLDLLDLEPRALMRRQEAEYKTLALSDEDKTRAELVAAMAANPKLIERPVVITNDRAVLGRPPENALELI